MLDFRVYTFLAVCEYMNYTRAAEALHITQPAVSQHIRYLENMYQVKLFLAEGKKGSKPHMTVDPPFLIEGEVGFSPELLRIYHKKENL